MARGKNHERLARRTAADSSGDNQRILTKLEASANDLMALRIIANSPVMLGPFVRFTSALLHQTKIERSTVECAILFLAGRADQPYEIREHEIMGAASGLTDEQIRCLLAGEIEHANLDSEQALVVELADAVRTMPTVPAELWERCSSVWGDDGLIEILLVISFYGGMMPMFLNAMGMD